MRSASAWRSRSASAPRAAAELRGDQHAVADRLAVAEAAVLRDRFERVAGRVAEVQDPAQARFASRRPATTSALMRHDSAMIGVSDVRLAREDRLALARRSGRTAPGSTSCRT